MIAPLNRIARSEGREENSPALTWIKLLISFQSWLHHVHDIISHCIQH
jgi:hypothetical protein